jgi:hypothetical protein
VAARIDHTRCLGDWNFATGAIISSANSAEPVRRLVSCLVIGFSYVRPSSLTSLATSAPPFLLPAAFLAPPFFAAALSAAFLCSGFLAPPFFAALSAPPFFAAAS